MSNDCPEAFSGVGGMRIDGRAECPHCGRWVAAHRITGRLRPHRSDARHGHDIAEFALGADDNNDLKESDG